MLKKEVQRMTNQDISKQTVLVLLVLTIVVSVIGTWTVLNSAVGEPIVISAPPKADIGNAAKVSLGVGEFGEQQETPVPAPTEGSRVSLTVN